MFPQVIVTMEWYSASTEEHDTTTYFLIFHEIGKLLKKIWDIHWLSTDEWTTWQLWSIKFFYRQRTRGWKVNTLAWCKPIMQY